eukprot:5111282-Amphidinium_carterae.1
MQTGGTPNQTHKILKQAKDKGAVELCLRASAGSGRRVTLMLATTGLRAVGTHQSLQFCTLLFKSCWSMEV